MNFHIITVQVALNTNDPDPTGVISGAKWMISLPLRDVPCVIKYFHPKPLPITQSDQQRRVIEHPTFFNVSRRVFEGPSKE